MSDSFADIIGLFKKIFSLVLKVISQVFLKTDLGDLLPAETE